MGTNGRIVESSQSHLDPFLVGSSIAVLEVELAVLKVELAMLEAELAVLGAELAVLVILPR